MKVGQGVASVETAIALLKVVAAARGGIMLSELARQMESTPSKMHHYVSSLVRAGMLTQDAASLRYALGVDALQMGLAALAASDVMHTAQTALNALVEKTGHTGLVCVRGPAGVTIVRWQEGAEPVYTTLAVGSVLPYSRSANGLVFAAHMRSTALRAALKPEGTNALALHNELEQVRQDGFARTRGGLVAGLNALAAPVFSSAAEVVCSLALVSAVGDLNAAAQRALLKAAADASKALGYQN
jgi:DNA-binding IclR family transcriptional regulator